MSTIAAKRSLGQHFLVDRNVLGVIARLAALQQDDIVLEIGPGLGILTRFLAERVRHVHAIEIDRGLEPALREALQGRSNVSLVFGDALELDVEQLAPAPVKLVANLPYNVATPIVAETLRNARSLEAWCVMVQREVADRFFAAPGTKAYGAVSVLVHLHARRTGFHPVARTVFRPAPRVDSALVAFERRDAPVDVEPVLDVVAAAFAHRRKTLANGLALAGLATREDAVAALARIGRPADVRAEALAPEELVSLTRQLRP